MQVFLRPFLRFVRLDSRAHQVLVLELLKGALLVGNDKLEWGEQLACFDFEQLEGALDYVKFGRMPVIPTN